MMEKGYVVEGFSFTEEKTAEQAKREAEGVKYIRENMDMENAETVLRLYHKLMAEQLFETPIGLGFLKELRDYLLSVPGIEEQELETIPGEIFYKKTEEPKTRRKKTAENSRMEKQQQQIKKRLRTSVIFNFFLIIVVIGMIAVTMTSEHPNIINYENNLIDKYAQWQKELDEREKVIREKERELEIVP